MKKKISFVGLILLAVCFAVLLVACISLLPNLPKEPPVLKPGESPEFLMLKHSFNVTIYICSLAAIIVGYVLYLVLGKPSMFYIVYLAGAIVASITAQGADFLVIFGSLAVVFLLSVFFVNNLEADL